MALLMEPGPTQVDHRVVQAMCRPPIHHLSVEFVRLADRLCADLGRIFRTDGEVVLLPSSGRGGIEAVLASVPVTTVVVPSNGAFGRMLAQIARRTGHRVVELQYAFGETIPAGEVADALARESAGMLAVVHCESSTGMLNDVARLARTARSTGATVLVDAISSLGGSELDMDGWEIDFCVSASQKAIGAVTGLAMVALNGRGTGLVLGDRPPRSNYFDLRQWWTLWLVEERGGAARPGGRRFPFSMPTHPVFALDAACRLLLEEGLESRITRHVEVSGAFRSAMNELGIGLLCAGPDAAPTLTAITGAEGLTPAAIKQALESDFDITVAGSMDPAVPLARVGHMAESARLGPMRQVTAAIESIVRGPVPRSAARR